MSGSSDRLDELVEGEWWRDQALCKGVPTEVFFSNHTKQQARRTCAVCPVNICCLDYALTFENEFGIWGGFSPRQRSRYRAELTHYAKAKLRQGRWGTVAELRSHEALDEAQDGGSTGDTGSLNRSQIGDGEHAEESL